MSPSDDDYARGDWERDQIQDRRLEEMRERDNAISDHKQADVDTLRALHERNEAREQRDRLAENACWNLPSA